MKIVLWGSQKTDAMPLPADGTVLTFFEVNFPLLVQFFDYLFV